VPRLAGLRVDGGLRGPAWASRAARVRRWVRIWAITDVWVMNATNGMEPRHVGHASGSTSKICWNAAAVGPSPNGGWPRSARVGARGRWRVDRPRRRAPTCAACHGGGWHTSHSRLQYPHIREDEARDEYAAADGYVEEWLRGRPRGQLPSPPERTKAREHVRTVAHAQRSYAPTLQISEQRSAR
jgi:hypothetical protein